MATSNTDWLQRRRKRTRCKTHGLHYDPSLTSGCVLCRKEGSVEEPEREGATLLPLLLSLLGISVVAYQLSSAELTSQVEPKSRTSARIVHLSGLPGLDPEPFRDGIEAVEAELFDLGTGGFDPAVAGAVERLDELALSLEEAGQPSAGLADQVRELAETAPEPDAGYDDLMAFRQEWIRLRRRAFESAIWFRGPGVGLERAAILAWRDASNELVDLLRQTTDLLQTAPATLGTSRSGGSDWASWAGEVDRRLASIRGELPGRPNAEAGDHLLTSVLDLERSLEGSRTTIRAAEPVSTDRITSLLESAERARRGFERHLAG